MPVGYVKNRKATGKRIASKVKSTRAQIKKLKEYAKGKN